MAVHAKPLKEIPLVPKKAVIAAGIVLGVLILCYLISFLIGYTIDEDCITLPTEAGGDYDLGIYQKQAALLGADGLELYDKKGNLKSTVEAKFADPRLAFCGKFGIMINVGGKEILHLKNGKNDFTIQTQQPIQTASVNEDGYTAVITSESGYKSLVTVYDDAGQERYRWYSGELYVIDAKLSSDSEKMAVAGVSTDGEQVSSSVLFFDLNEENPAARTDCENTMIYQLHSTRRDVYVISDAFLKKIGYDGKVKKEYSFGGRTLQAFDLENPDCIAVSLNQSIAAGGNSANSEIILLNKNLKTKGSKNLPVSISMLDEEQGKIAAGGQRQVYLLTSGGRVYGSGKLANDAKTIRFMEDRKHLAAVSGNLATIFTIRFGKGNL